MTNNPILIMSVLGWGFKLDDQNLLLSATWSGKKLKDDWMSRNAIVLGISDGLFMKIHDDLEFYSTFKSLEKRAAPLGPEVAV